MAHKGYTLNYFIDFFKSIPSNKWTTGKLVDSEAGQACALGFAQNALGGRASYERAEALDSFLDGKTASINDNRTGAYDSLGERPRTRILNALRNRKRNGSVL